MTDLLYWASEQISDFEGVMLLALLLGGAAALVIYRVIGRRDQTESASVADLLVERPPVVIESPLGGSAADEFLARTPSPAFGAGLQPETGQTPVLDPAPALERPVRYRLRSRDIREAFQGRVPRVRASVLYHFWMLLVAGTVVLLPLAYLALVGTVAYGLYYYGFHYREIIFSAGVNRLTLVAFILPLLVGLGVLLFMVSPLFVFFARGREQAPVELDPARDPLIFCLIEEVCKAVGSPMPRKVYVNCDANASAGLRRGIWSALSGGDLVLTIGLPLVAAMNVNQLAGVLAHEFGHFKQGTGMALSYVIRRVNYWFSMLVYRPAGWDDDPEGSAEFSILEFLIRICINVTRGILWVLLTAAHAVSSSLLRQQEYDADRHEALLVGADNFSSTTLLFPQLHAATGLAYKDLRRALHRTRGRPALAASLPHLILTKLDELPGRVREEIMTAELGRKTGVFDTHPAPQARIDTVERLDAPGLFHLDLPATDLFSTFNGLCTEATLDHYRTALGPLVQSDVLIPNEEFLARYGERITFGG